MPAPKSLAAAIAATLLLVAPAVARPPAHLASRASPAAPVPVPDSEVCVAAMRGVGGTGAGAFPPNLLNAIGRVESGRTDKRDGVVKAWPWTINAEGKGTLYESKDDAIAAVNALRARGVTSIDVGCMQVNLAWHPDAFASLEDAFDPTINVRYAARFLRALYVETADWDVAAAYYHSKTPDLALAYQQKVLAQMGGAGIGTGLGLGLHKPGPLQPPHDDLASAWAATVSPSQGGASSFLNAAWMSAAPPRHAAKPSLLSERDRERHALQEAMLFGSVAR